MNSLSWPIRLTLLVVLGGQSLWGQAPEDMGPYAVGERSVNFQHPLASASTVTADIYYPATSAGNSAPPDVASGPFPLVGFFHGYFAPPSFYDDLLIHLASYGFVVAAVSTQTGLFQSIIAEAHDGHALLHWCDAENLDQGSFLHSMLGPGPWSAVGHSNGVAAIFEVLAWENRVRTVVSTEGNWFALPAVGQFTGSFLSIGSSQDSIAPQSANARRYYDEAQNTRRRVWALIQGGGHNGSLDFQVGFQSLPHATQHRLHRRLVAGFMRAEVKHEEDNYYHLVGSGMGSEPVDTEGHCAQPVLWLHPEPAPLGGLTIGIMGRPMDACRIFQTSGGTGMWTTTGATAGGGRSIMTRLLDDFGVGEHHWSGSPGSAFRVVADCATGSALPRRTRRGLVYLP